MFAIAICLVLLMTSVIPDNVIQLPVSEIKKNENLTAHQRIF